MPHRYFFGKASEEHLENVDPQLVKVHRFVITFYDHMIVDGLRTMAEQVKNVARGVSKTLASKHLPDAKTKKSKATDSMPYPPVNYSKVERSLNAIKAIDPNLDILRFYHFQGVMLGASKAMGIELRQGIDWNGNNDLSDQSFFDLPHNEIED